MSTNERDLIVGGQAVIEGVMMRTPNAYAIAVRKADGTIVNTAARLPKWSDKYPLLKLPVLRGSAVLRSEEHTSELQSRLHLVCRLLLEKKKKKQTYYNTITTIRAPV